MQLIRGEKKAKHLLQAFFLSKNCVGIISEGNRCKNNSVNNSIMNLSFVPEDANLIKILIYK